MSIADPIARTIVTWDKTKHRIVIDLGDDADREEIARLVDRAMDFAEGKRESKLLIERIVAVRPLPVARAKAL